MKKILSFLGAIVLAGCSESYPAFENPTVPLNDGLFFVKRSCTQRLVIWVPDNHLTKYELDHIRKNTRKITIPITLDVTIKNKNKEIVYSKNNVSFEVQLGDRHGEQFVWGFGSLVAVLDRGRYYLSTTPSTLGKQTNLSDVKFEIISTCKNFF